MKNFVIILWGLILLSGCHSKEKTLKLHTYFDLDSLLNHQLIGANDPPLVFSKEVILDGKREEKVISFDSVAWVKELKILRDFEINKPDYVGVYDIAQERDNLHYTLKAEENSPVKSLNVLFKDGVVAEVVGVFFEDKSIYQHEREMKLYFSSGKMETYEFDGFQSMIMKDTITYSVKSRFIH